MPPRLNKRQQRELEELETLGANESASDEEVEMPVKKGRPAFSELFEDDDEQDVESSEVKKKKPKKKKKAAAATQASATAPAPSTSSPKPVVEQSKLSSKKAAKKAKKAKKDELDEALAELSVKYPDIQLHASASSAATPALSTLLTISPNHLDSQAEMRRLFGARVVDSAETSTPNDVHARRRAAALGKTKSTLTKPKPTWPPPKMRDGLTARVMSTEEVGDLEEPGERWWTVEYSKRYRSVTKSFLRTVLSGDPQGFYDIIRQAPWHADTLLQLSELYRHREEHAPAIDFVDRAMFAYERAFVGMGSFGGKNRLDFREAENRVFYLALHRQTADLARRGCTRTSFEFGKLMYSLDPWTDPHGALLHLEIGAVRAGMGSWLVQVYDVSVARRGNTGKMNASLLPGWAYSRALALYAEDKDKASKALVEAFQTFPEVAPLLADKLDVSFPETLRGHADFRIHPDASTLSTESAILHLLSHYYVQRSTAIWKGSEKIAWFRATLSSYTHPSTPSPTHQQSLDMFKNSEVLCHSIYRHTVVLSLSNLFKYFSPTSEMTKLACDPVPPPDATSSYMDTDFFEGVQDPFLHARTGGIVIDDNMREQLHVLFERFGGGGIDFEQFVERLQVGGEGALMELVQGALVEFPQHGENGEMPGALFEPDQEERILELPGQRDNARPQEEDEDDDDDDENEDDASMPVRMFRNIVGRFGFWGNNADYDEESSEDEQPRGSHGARDSDVD